MRDIEQFKEHVGGHFRTDERGQYDSVECIKISHFKPASLVDLGLLDCFVYLERHVAGEVKTEVCNGDLR